MDGQNIETVHNQSTNIRQPQALTIDYDSQTLYWSDAILNKILWSRVEPGSDISYFDNQAYDIDIFGRILFIADSNGIQFRSINGTEQYNIIDDICNASFYGINVISEQRQAQGVLISVCT